MQSHNSNTHAAHCTSFGVLVDVLHEGFECLSATDASGCRNCIDLYVKTDPGDGANLLLMHDSHPILSCPPASLNRPGNIYLLPCCCIGVCEGASHCMYHSGWQQAAKPTATVSTAQPATTNTSSHSACTTTVGQVSEGLTSCNGQPAIL